jgi:hypothetical protein
MSAVIGFVKGLTGHPPDIGQGLEYVWLESPVKACLAQIKEVQDWNNLKVWPSGRLFGEPGEYRWQHLKDGCLHKVLLLEDPPLPADFDRRVDLENIAEEDLILWGKWINPKDDPQSKPTEGPVFYANEIPQVILYPVDLKGPPKENETPRLIIRRYRDIKGEKGEFVRCVGFTMKPADEEE